MAETWQVSSAEVGRLVTRIFDPSRTAPLVVVSPSQSGRSRISVPRLIGLIPPDTEVAVLASQAASNLLSDAVDPQFHCYGGRVRVILPGASRTDNWRRHRLFTIAPEDDADRLCALIARHVTEMEGVGPAGHSSGRSGTGALDSGQAAKLIAYRRRLLSDDIEAPGAAPAASTALAAGGGPIAGDDFATTGDAATGPTPVPGGGRTSGPKPGPGRRRAVPREPEPVVAPGLPAAPGTPAEIPVPEPVPAPGMVPAPAAGRAPEPVPPPEAVPTRGAPGEERASSRTVTVDLATLEKLLDRSVETVAGRVIAGVEEGLLSLLRDEFELQDGEHSRADALEEQNADLRRRLDAVGPHGSAPAQVYSDPAAQLRWEIEQEWLLGTPETDRGAGLRGFSFGPRFLDSLKAEIVPRGKTVRVMVDILAGWAWDRHITHPFNDSPRGGKQRVRADGAQAWRTYVKAESPGAPRLTWWMRTDSGIEFDHVGHHDQLI
ncbi:MAG: hypothetical protein L0K84_02095 [Acidipropionibacterium jensenii]|nr:hypothetical protein [Acidipropionibacterium jensenii]